MFRLEATKPAVSISAPAPTVTPLGLIRNTRPFESSWPSSAECSGPVTRLSTALAAPDCTKRATSSARIEKPCQLMIVPGAFVTVRFLPTALKLAAPLTTDGPTGLASAAEAKQDATAIVISRRRKARVVIGSFVLHPSRDGSPTEAAAPSTAYDDDCGWRCAPVSGICHDPRGKSRRNLQAAGRDRQAEGQAPTTAAGEPSARPSITPMR